MSNSKDEAAAVEQPQQPQTLKKTLLKAISLVFLIIFILLLCLELTDRFAFRPKSIFAKSVMDFEKQKSEIQILFCGQSDVKYGIIPDEFDSNTFNFAGTGESFIETYYKLEHSIRDMPKLKIVVLPVTLHSFTSNRSNEISWPYFTYGYISYSDILELYKLKGMVVVKEKLLSFCPNLRSLQMRIFLRNMKKVFKNQPIDKAEIHKGYVKYEGSYVEEKWAKKRIKRYFDGQVVFDEDLLLYFEKILELCRNNDVKVVALTLPLTDYFLKYSEKYITEDSLYENVLRNPRYSKYIYKHIDYLEDSYAGNHDLFLNQDHLNHKGALKFSKLAAAELSEVMREIADVKQLPKEPATK